MKTINDVKEGDIVWYDDVNNRTKRPPVECKVAKIGTKLITVKSGPYSEMKFRKDSLRAADTYGHQWLILDLQDEADRKEKAKLVTLLRTRSVSADATLDDVRQALKLLGIEEE